MVENKTAFPYIDLACRQRLPKRLADVFRAVDVELSSGSRLHIRTAAINDWWLSSVEGSGCVTFKAEDREAFSNHALLLLTLRGEHRRVNYKPLFPPVGQISLGLSVPRDTSRSSGDFAYLVLFVPLDQLDPGKQGVIPYGYSIDAGHGAGAILAASMLRLVEEAIQGVGDHAIAPILPAFANLVVSTLGQKDNPAVFHITNPRRMSRIGDCLNRHYADAFLTPARVAEMIGISRRQLNREFERAGETFGTRLRILRLTKARELLSADGEMTVTQVAYEVGFSSPTLFGRLFKEHFGLTPREFVAAVR